MTVWIIARLTFKEAVRRRIALAALLLGLAFLAVFSLGLHLIIDRIIMQEGQMDAVESGALFNFFTMAGLYVTNFLVIIMAALVTAGALAGEISSGAIQSLATKPVHRAEIVLGKWLGFAALLALYVLLMAGGLLLSVSLQTGSAPPNIERGLALLYLQSLVMMSVTLAFSSALSTLAAGGAVFGLYGLAFIGSWVEQIGSFMDSQDAIQIGIITSLLMPSEAAWRRASFEMTSPLVQFLAGAPFISRSIPSPLMIWYAVFYVLVAVAVAVLIFQRRDL
jgi:ABC-type transport system involved in multi-copper enzyme maturation permease subunit